MMIKKHNRRSGFSLLELLLALSVFTALLLAFFSILQVFAERELARSTSKYMTTVAAATDQILRNIDNFNALYAAAATAGGSYELVADASLPAQDNITKTFTVNGVTIQATRLLNDNFRYTTPMRARVHIILSVADNTSISTDAPALDIVVVTDRPRPDSLIRRAATEAGSAGGWIRTYANKSAAMMESAFGGWRVPVNKLANTSWYTSNLNGTNDAGLNGSYLVHYTYLNSEEIAGDYLYRVQDFNPILKRNTMYAPINLGGNDIVGIDNLNVGNDGSAQTFASGTVDAECNGSVLCVNGTGILKGSGTIGGTMTTAGSALVADSMIAGNMRVQNDLTPAQRQTYGAQGLFVVDGNGNDGGGVQDTVVVGNDALFADGTTARYGSLGNMRTVNVTMPQGGQYVTGNVVNTRRISSTNITGNVLIAEHELKAGIVDSSTVQLIAGRAAVIDVNQTTRMIHGDISNPRTTIVPRLNVGTMYVNNFGECGIGCE